MARTHAAEESVMYAVTSRNNRRGVARGVLGSGVFCGSAPRLYNEDLTQLELELSRVPVLAVAAENWESRQSKVIENNGDKGIWLCKEDFLCDLKLEWECYLSVARKRLVESVIDWEL
jgi:hypothetical protein